MIARIGLASRLEWRELLRRPLLWILLVALPFFFITRSIAKTVPEPRIVPLPGGGEFLSNMQDVHGATMAGITIAFLAGLCGLFIMQSARGGDRRLVIAGYRPVETVLPRLILIGAMTGLIVAISVTVTALSFTPQQWVPFVGANLMVGVIYGSIGALAGVVLGRVGGTYFILFMAMVDLGIAQTPMFGDGRPDGWAQFLPGYGIGRVLVDASFSPSFHAAPELALAAIWTGGMLAAVTWLLARWLRSEAA